jgi:RNA polymerase sigma factor (sigma-70 family)
MINISDIYTKYYSELIAFSYNITKSQQKAEDAVSELFRRFVRTSQRLVFVSEDMVRAWMYKALRRCCYTIYKKESKYLTLTDAETENIVDEKDFLKDSCNKEKVDQHLQMLNEEITKLPPKQQQVILLRYFSGGIMSYAEIAKRTGSNENAVGFHISKATDKLRSRLVAKWQTQHI